MVYKIAFACCMPESIKCISNKVAFLDQAGPNIEQNTVIKSNERKYRATGFDRVISDVAWLNFFKIKHSYYQCLGY